MGHARGVNSFNDWTHGNQIEPAALEVEPPYESYAGDPKMYLEETAKHVETFMQRWAARADGKAGHDEL